MSVDQDIWQMLEAEAPDGCADVQDLYSWSLNYDAGRGPFVLFLDLIGWSEDETGDLIFNNDRGTYGFGYLELSKLADALNEYTSSPNEVRAYVDALMEAESA